MSRGLTLYRKHSPDELHAMQERIKADPANRMPKGSVYLYIPKARKELDAIAWAITYHITDKKERDESFAAMGEADRLEMLERGYGA